MIMAAGNSTAEVKALMPQVKGMFAKHALVLKNGKVPIDELVFVKHVSKDTKQHSNRNTVENDALGRLAKEGKLLKAGQTLRFVVASHKKQARKAIPLELVDERTAYDPDRTWNYWLTCAILSSSPLDMQFRLTIISSIHKFASICSK